MILRARVSHVFGKVGSMLQSTVEGLICCRAKLSQTAEVLWRHRPHVFWRRTTHLETDTQARFLEYATLPRNSRCHGILLSKGPLSYPERQSSHLERFFKSKGEEFLSCNIHDLGAGPSGKVYVYYVIGFKRPELPAIWPVSPQNLGLLAELCSTADKALDRGLKHGTNFPEHVQNTGPQDHPKWQWASALRAPPWAHDFLKPKEREPRERPCFPSSCKFRIGSTFKQHGSSLATLELPPRGKTLDITCA
ncbi:hypothetical protein WN51_12871 [Melipona quadrifasciata]|uniref:Uncharacterized protein n=1 Tax=Melipona quadrifasciata TaxID=166423 RepID=A0A0M9A549_9HYME|nr:hypothetical protein WN51_12871 [Melipona quadrifasciata]